MLFCTGDVPVRAVLIVRIAFISLVSHQMIFHRTESGTESCHWPEALKPSWFGVIQLRFWEHEDERVCLTVERCLGFCKCTSLHNTVSIGNLQRPHSLNIPSEKVNDKMSIWDFEEIKVKTQ